MIRIFDVVSQTKPKPQNRLPLLLPPKIEKRFKTTQDCAKQNSRNLWTEYFIFKTNSQNLFSGNLEKIDIFPVFLLNLLIVTVTPTNRRKRL